MEDNINSLKRHRNESGQGEYGSQEKKPFTQSSSEGTSRAYTKRRSFSMSFSSFSSASLSSMETTCSSADETESMICDPSSEEVFLKPEQQKIEKLDKFSLDIKRGLDIARYEIKISYGSGKWSTIKEEMKLTICKYVRAAGNSLGGLIDVDVNAVMFPDDKHKKVLNEFYRDIELEVFLKWEKSERPIRESTEGKGLIIYVPMFKNLKSENTNVIDSGEESHPQLNDQMVQHLLEADEGKYESRFQRFASFEKQFDWETIEYNTPINCGSEATNLEFKLLTDGEGLTKRILKKSNKLLLYISAFGIRDGGLVMYGIEDATGHAKGQVLSGYPEKKHYFENIKQQILHDVGQHTVCLKRDKQRCDPTDLLEIDCIPVINTPPEMLRQIDNENDYYAVIVIHIKPFDGIIFTSSRGPEAYKITQTLGSVRDTADLDINRVSSDEWVTEKSRKITTKMITNGVCKLNLQFTSAAEGTNVFELPDSVKSIREKIFKVSGKFTIYPEGFLQGRHLPVITQIQRSFTATSDEGIILAELYRGVAVYLFIISKQCGLHLCMLPVQKCRSVEILMDTLSIEAMKLKKRLFEIGGCQLNLVIRTHFISADDFDIKLKKLEAQMHDTEIYTVLDSYIRVIGSFPNSCLKHQLGVEVLNVLTEKQFQLLLRLRLDTCRRLWVHGLPGSGKTVLAVMMINYLVKHEGPVLFVAENEGLVLKLESLLKKEWGEEVRCISRIKFVSLSMESLGDIRNIVMDEVHHYRLEKRKPHWYTRAKKVVAGKGPNGRNGYLWLFLDMFQKENTFNSGIPVLGEQEPIETLTEVIRCSCSVWAAVKRMLRNVTINASDCRELYKYMLSRSTCPHAVEGQVVEICPPQDRPDNSFGLHFQVGGKVAALLDQHWRPEDIGILFSKKEDADTFSSQYNRLIESSNDRLVDSSRGIRFKLCTEDVPNSIVCDSVRRFSGMEKPCVILVKPTVNEVFFSANAFQALGMSRAMIKLIVITEKAGPRRTRSGAASALLTP